MQALLGGCSLIVAALGLGFVILVHELGHFLFAKWAGVRVHMFAIGFPPILWRIRVGETDYALGALPLGGFVAMQDEEDPTDPASKGRSLAAAPAWWRFLVLGAGVVFNVIASLLVLVALAWYGMPIIEPVVGKVDGLESPARQLGLRRSDRILTVNDEGVRSFQDIQLILFAAGGKPLHLEVERDGRRLVLGTDANPVYPVYDPDLGAPSLGIQPPHGRTICLAVGQAMPQQPLVGWTVQAVAGHDVQGMLGQDLEQRLLPWYGRPVDLELRRDGETRHETITYLGSPEEDLGGPLLGLPVVVSSALPGMPAAEAGLQAGDLLTAINGETLASRVDCQAAVRRAAEAGTPVRLGYRRFQDGAWSDREALLPLRQDPSTGDMILGVAMGGPPLGPIPWLPPTFLGVANPLRQAGLQDGDVLIEHPPLALSGVGLEKVQVRYLRGGEILRIPLDEGEWQALIRRNDLHPFVKILRLADERSMYELLLGRVLAVRGELLSVADGTGNENLIHLEQVPPGLRDALSKLRADDRIICNEQVLAGRQLLVVRGGEAREATVTPRLPGVVLGFGVEKVPYRLRSWTEAFTLAATESWSIVAKTAQLIPKFFQRKEAGGVAHTKSLAGPIGIFVALKDTLRRGGLPDFLRLLAFLGLNLALVNLLPIPIADGGRLLVVGIETVIRRRLPGIVAQTLNGLGLAFVVLLFVYVILLDVARGFV